MNFVEVLKKIPTPQVSIPQIPKLNLNSSKEDGGKAPLNMTQVNKNLFFSKNTF